MTETPVTRIKRHSDGIYSLIIECPHCNKLHTHGGGTDPHQVQTFLGHRSAHCGGEGDYVLTDTLGVVSRFMMRVKHPLPDGYTTETALRDDALDHIANAMWCLSHLDPTEDPVTAVAELAQALWVIQMEGSAA